MPDATGSNRYRVNVIHTDGQGYVTEYADREAFILQLMRLGMDDDVDDDGLIDVYYLEDLDAIREHLKRVYLPLVVKTMMKPVRVMNYKEALTLILMIHT